MIGKIIKDLREYRGLSLRAIEEQKGFSRSSQSQIESGKRNISWEKIEAYADALGFEIDPKKLRAAFVEKGTTEQEFEETHKLTDNDIFI